MAITLETTTLLMSMSTEVLAEACAILVRSKDPMSVHAANAAAAELMIRHWSGHKKRGRSIVPATAIDS